VSVESLELHRNNITDTEQYKLIQEKALAGEPEFQYYLGLMFDTGRGVKRSPKDAIKWYSKAATSGVVNAQYYLGLLYDTEESGVPKDPDEAIKWFSMAAEEGHSMAKVRLNILLGF
tara:strand:- start:5 stop:355 length:351 start_codon:yes stop_codon:yes gene_type:complete